MKKHIIINALPVALWAAFFALALATLLFESDTAGNIFGMLQICLLFLVPLFYGIYNSAVCRKTSEMAKLFAVSAAAETVGVLLNGILCYLTFSYDPETPEIVKVYTVGTFILSAAVAVIAILSKALYIKIKQLTGRRNNEV